MTGIHARMRADNFFRTFTGSRKGLAFRMIIASGLLIALTVVLILRGTDVRLGLMGCALAIGAIAGDIRPIVQEFFLTLTSEKFVVPICCAMGFAHVLKQTECDQHLVRLLTNPLKRVRFLLIPGVVLVGFTVNIPVISQTSAAVCIGAVVLPLMKAAGFSALTIGSTLILGASIGGELLNPGAPELNTVANALHIDSKEVIRSILPLVIPHLIIALLVFWWLRSREERKLPLETMAPVTDLSALGVNYFKAAIPLFPLLFLLLSGPPLNLFAIPKNWLTDDKTEKFFSARLIGVAMIGGCAIAGLASPSKIKGVAKAFFEGAGYAFAEVVSLIVIAQCFGKAIELAGFKSLLEEFIKANEPLLLPLAAGVPGTFAFISGSGMAATSSLYGIFVEPAKHLGHDPMDVGALVSVASAAGRTMSPFAAVVLMVSKLTGTNPFALVRRVAPPLIVGIVAIVILRGLKAI